MHTTCYVNALLCFQAEIKIILFKLAPRRRVFLERVATKSTLTLRYNISVDFQ